MRGARTWSIALGLVVIWCWLPTGNHTALASIVRFYSPRPYEGIADSPWAVSLGADSEEWGGYFLEDFEDGKLNTPGTHSSSVGGENGLPMVFGGEIKEGHSVDPGGMSVQSKTLAATLSIPPIYFTVLTFMLDANALGSLPRDVGFAWTGDKDGINIQFTALDRNGDPLGQLVDEGDGSIKFLGASHPDGIGGIRIYARRRSETPFTLAIDHLQYGGRSTALAEPRIPGDADGDGLVSLNDFAILKETFGTRDLRADFSDDGIINLADFDILKQNFGNPATPVPEPSILDLAIIALLTIGIGCLRRVGQTEARRAEGYLNSRLRLRSVHRAA